MPGLWLRSVTGLGAARVSLRGWRPVPRPAGRAGRERGRRRSGCSWHADADLGGRGAGGDAASGGGEGRAGLGFPVAVPVAVDDDPVFPEDMHGAVTEGGGHGGGQAGGGGTGPDAGQGSAASGSEGNLPGLDRLAGEAALAGGGCLAGGGAGQGPGQFGGADPGGVLLIDQLRGPGAEDRPAEGPAPVMADLASLRQVSDPGHRQA